MSLLSREAGGCIADSRLEVPGEELPVQGLVHWYDPVAGIQSLGSKAERPGSLAGLHQAREEHLGQFFTPEPLARFLWGIVEPAINKAIEKTGSKVALFDNSCGTGRLLRFADPERHILGGVDIHEESVLAFARAATAAGFETDINVAGMEDIRASGYSVGLINPPFSINLVSPNLSKYPSATRWGKFGPHSSTLSHEYALHQALGACDIVAAILPSSYAKEVVKDEGFESRLRACIDLPRGVFSEEGTEVSVTVLVFGRHAWRDDPALFMKVKDLSESVPELDLSCENARWRRPSISIAGVDDSKPSITLPVTGNNTVRIGHSGRKVGVSFKCGLTQARVMNEVLRGTVERVPQHRYPKGVQYLGQGMLDIEVHLLQPDPLGSFGKFVGEIKEAGGKPDVDPGLWNYLKKRTRQLGRQRTPLAHTIYVSENDTMRGEVVVGVALKKHLANPEVWGSAIIPQGEEISFRPLENGCYEFEFKGKPYQITRDNLFKKFEIRQGKAKEGWERIYEGRAAAFPEIAASWIGKAKKAGVDKFLTWDYQFRDLIELFVSPTSAACCWMMGLGKARLSAGIILTSGARHGLIVVEPHLVPEMKKELSGICIDQGCWQIIDGPNALKNLKTINVISYSRLRSLVDGSSSKKATYAKMLRRRVGVLVADEGHLLRNQDTQQSRALWQISARRRFILTGTPIANYPRDILPLIAFCGGDGTAAQPYGLRRAYLEERFRSSMNMAERGIDRFKNEYVTLEWCTDEFAETLRKGAKREIPRIANLDEFREMIAPHILRRVTEEPDVVKHFRIPKPSKKTTVLDWDPKHLAFYLEVAQDFVSWFKSEVEKAREEKKNVNLVALLARIQAIQFASNYPQHSIKGKVYTELTSKQRYLIKRIVALTREGHKVICYARWPGLLELLARQLENQGLESVVLHGGRDIEERTRDLDERFRFGAVPVLLASLGVTQTGLNLFQANRVIFAERDWCAKTEDQAAARVLRPQQVREVKIEFVHLDGGIDIYQDQMVAMKSDSARAGVDWSAPETAHKQFEHLDTLLGRFCEDLAERYGCESYELREKLASGE